MKIAQVCPYDIDRPGGVQRHILDLGAALRELGHEVHVFAPGPAPATELRSDPSTCYVGRRKEIGFSGTQFEVTHADRRERERAHEVLRSERFDIVHFHTLWTPLLSYQLLRLTDTAVVATFHDTPPTGAGGFALRQLFRLLARLLRRRVDHAIAVSESPARHLGAFPRTRLSLLPPCIDYRPCLAVAGHTAEAGAESPLTVLFLGRLEPRKAPGDLIRACSQLQRQGLALRLRIAGDGPLRDELETLAASEGLADCTFLGRIDEADKPQLYATADLFCAPSRFGESFGIVVAEAMAAGVAVIAAANSGYRTVLRDGGECGLYPPGNVDALGTCIRALAEDSEQRASHARWGHARARGYDARALAPRFVAVYEQALAHAALR